VVANDAVQDDRGKIAIERGPLVFCAENADNRFPLKDFGLKETANFVAAFNPSLLNGVMTLTGEGTEQKKSKSTKPVPLKLIPYYAWSNRGCGEMTVWFRLDK
jgi:DUF1680 family protein